MEKSLIFYNSKYFTHAVILLSLALLIIIGVSFDVAWIGAFLGGAAGAFSLNDPIILMFCIIMGFVWSGSSKWLFLWVTITNIAYRLWLSASHIMQYKNTENVTIFEPSFLQLFASSYGAIQIAFLCNVFSLFIVQGIKAIKNEQPL